ncbi:MAG: hypothetical protein HXY40_18630 [Chloroflexi bacterium]|nr:hypothetical protein [Chloroflexota bacterium]
MIANLRARLRRFEAQPLVTAELRIARRYHTQRKNGFGTRLAGFVNDAMLALAAALLASEFARAALNYTLPLPPLARLGVMGFAIFALAAYSSSFRQMSLLTTMLVARDKQSSVVWEMVVLTGVDARTYVRAKWWALLRVILPGMWRPALIRAGGLAFVVGELSRQDAFTRFGAGYVDAPSVFDLLVLVALSFVLTYAQAPLWAATNLDAQLDSQRHGNSWWGTFQRRLLLLGSVALLGFGLLVGMFVGLRGALASEWMLLVAFLCLTALDGGFIISLQLPLYIFVRFNTAFTPPVPLPSAQILLIGLLSLLLVALLTAFFLRMAQWTAGRYQLLPAPKTRAPHSTPHHGSALSAAAAAED